MFNPRFFTLAGMVLCASLTRLIPHPWNVTPVAAMALFGGAHFNSKPLAFFLPLCAMLASDLFLGFYKAMPFVYGSFALIVVYGMGLREKKRPGRIFLAVLAGSISFFLITNLGTWMVGGLYPRNLQGLWMCYAAAIPFFRSTFMGDLFFAAVLFGGFASAEKRFPILRADIIAVPLR